MDIVRLNLAFAWLWILLGFLSGAAMGMLFQRENWMGGYSSFPRRLYRLGHISFFGLGLINFLFAITLRLFPHASPLTSVAGGAFITGGVLMPICCLVMAHFPKLKAPLLFTPPVASLLLGGALTLFLILKP
jgi:hypothetical protein